MNTQQLIQKYQTEVDAIPDIRPLVTLYCEIAVKVLTELEAKCSPEMDDKQLMRFVMVTGRGFLPPNHVVSLINEWKQSKKE